MLTTESIEVVILRCPYQNWHVPEVGIHFANMIKLKLEGYQKEYQYGVLPFDTSDFVANHILIYEKHPTGSRLITALKSTPYQHCEPFLLEFNPYAVLRHGHAEKLHLQALDQIIHDCMNSSRQITYYSSWTILPCIREEKANVKFLKDVVTAVTFLHHQEEGIQEMLGFGVPRFKTDQYFSTWGLLPVQISGTELPKIYLETFSDTEVVFMHLKEYSTHAKECALQYKKLWNARKTIGNTLDFSHFERKKKAA